MRPEGNHNGEAISLKGLGSNVLVTRGSKKDVQLEYFSFKTTTTFHIVPSKSMKCPIILGRDFCQNERLELWLKKNMISKHFDGKARTDIYLDKKDEIMTVKTMIHENFTLYAIETIKIIKIKLHRECCMCGRGSRLGPQEGRPGSPAPDRTPDI